MSNMMEILPIKPIITKVTPQDARKVCYFVVPNNKIGDLYLEVKHPENSFYNSFITELRNRFHKLLGYEEFAFFEGAKEIFGLNIRVSDEYQRKGYNLGEILRLSSIIEIIENKIKNFDILSKDTAVYFHSKYKFKPDVTSVSDCDRLLKTVIEDKTPGFEKIAEKAKVLMQKIESVKSKEEQQHFCEVTNGILEEYITKAIETKTQKQHPFTSTMNMTLTDDTVYKNKEFFNDLFKKHGIDYKI